VAGGPAQPKASAADVVVFGSIEEAALCLRIGERTIAGAAAGEIREERQRQAGAALLRYKIVRRD
jgi:hypothetical protein